MSWAAIGGRDATMFGAAVADSLEGQVAAIPAMLSPAIAVLIEEHRRSALGWKLCGGGAT